MSDYRFNSQTVADKLTSIIDSSIGYVNKKQKKDKYFRGVTGFVSSTTADVYLFGSDDPIPNVKIASGIKHLFTGEDVYLTAIGGRLDNCIIDKRVIDYDLVFEDEIENFLTIDDFSKSNTTWACTNPSRATLVEANDYYKVYVASKKTHYISSRQDYTFESSRLINLTLFHDLSASTDDDLIFFSFYMGDGFEKTDYVELRFYKNSNYYSFILQGTSIVSGWNRIKQTKASFTNVGGMSSWASIDKISITIAYTEAIPLHSFVNFAYLGMARPYIASSVSSYVDTRIEEYISDGTNFDFYVDENGDYILGKTRKASITETEPTTPNVGDLWLDPNDTTLEEIVAGKQDKSANLTSISSITGTGVLLKSASSIYTSYLAATPNQIAITDESSTGGVITLGFATDYLKLYEKNAKFGVLYDSYTWNEDLSVLEMGAGASLSIPTVSYETNEFLLMNNFYKKTDGGFDNIFTGSGSAINLKRDQIDLIVTDTPSSFYDSSYLRLSETYSSSAPLPKLQICNNQIISQNNITLRTSVLDWYYDICKVIQIGDTGAVFAYIDANKNINISQNLLYDNTNHDYRRIEDTTATLYQQKSGEHAFYVAGSDSAGTAITFTSAFKIANDGNFYIGTRKLTVSDTEPSTPSLGDLWLDTTIV